MSDVVLVGGGLANALIALRLKRSDLGRRVVLIERESRVGNRRLLVAGLPGALPPP